MIDSASNSSNVLSAEDLFSGGGLVRLEIPEIPRNGQPGVVFIKPPSAADVLKFVHDRSADGGTDLDNDHMAALVAKCIVDESGASLFSEEQATHIQDVRMDVFTRLSEAITKLTNPTTDAEKNVPSGPGGSDLPIV